MITIRPPEKQNPGAGGLTGAARVNRQCENCFFNSRNFLKYQALCRLIFLQALIGPDFESELSLCLDSTLQELEALEGRRHGGPVHVGVVAQQVMADLARRRIGAERGGP